MPTTDDEMSLPCDSFSLLNAACVRHVLQSRRDWRSWWHRDRCKDDPNRCMYAGQPTTPALCMPADHAALRATSDPVEADAAGAHEEL